MANFGAKITMKIMTIAVGIPVGIATRKMVEKIWVAAGPDRPRSASDDGVQWTDAIAWAALTGVGMAVADLATRKGAGEVWRTVIGTEPPQRIKPKASKRVAAAQPKFPAAVQPPD
jgi:hypothetical protein